MWTSDSAYHNAAAVRTAAAAGLPHPGAWSQQSKGRGHLWSALLLLAVGVVTLAVLAVVALAIVLGGHHGSSSGGTLSSHSASLSPSATWGEEAAEEFYRPEQTKRPFIQQRPQSSSPSLSTVRRPVVTTTTTTTTSTTTSVPKIVRTTAKTINEESRMPLPISLDEGRRILKPSSPPFSGSYQVQSSVNFSPEDPRKSETRFEPAGESSWTPMEDSRQQGPVGVAEVSTIQEVEVLENARLPARSYSGLNGVSLRPMPTLFPADVKQEEEVTTTTMRPSTSVKPLPRVPINEVATDIGSPFFLASLTSLPSSSDIKVKPIMNNENSSERDEFNNQEFSDRMGLFNTDSKSFVNVALEEVKTPIEDPVQVVDEELTSSENSSSTDPTDETFVTDVHEEQFSPVSLLHSSQPLVSTSEPKLFVPSLVKGTAEPLGVITNPVVLVPTFSQNTEKPVSIFDINTTNPVILIPTYTKPVEKPIENLNNSNISNPELLIPTVLNATSETLTEEYNESSPTLLPDEDINTIHIAPTLEIIVVPATAASSEDDLTLVDTMSPDTTQETPDQDSDRLDDAAPTDPTPDDTPEPPEVTEGPILQMTSRASIAPGPTLVTLLRPVTAGQRTAEVDALGPIKAGLLFREPKSGSSKESLVQGFPKSEFNSVPAFLRRNNTGKKPLATAVARTPVTTLKVAGVDNCTCADRLRAQGLGRKLCDGVVDCWDYSDEENCEWCGPGQHVCAHSRACVSRVKLCDGRRDCPFGDDERACVSVAPDPLRANALQYHDDGLLMVQQSGTWGPLCVEKLDGSAWRLGDVARAVCRALTYSDFELAEQVIDPKNMGPYYELNFERNASRSSPRLAVRSSQCPSRAAVRLGCRDLQCGVRPLAVSQWARIVGGGNAGPGAWPWQAALYKEGQFQCGGSLIASQWLLSASHCFAHNLDAYWVARLGALRRGTDLASPFEQLRRLVRIIQHPGYLDSGFINDLALLKLERPVDFSDYVRPVCLPPPSLAPPPETKTEEPVPEGQMCTVVGWGQLSEVGRIFPDTLQEVQLPLIPTEECRRRTLFLPLYRVTEDMFCAGYDRGGRDACLGDSGGPLMCQRTDGHWELTGITSNGYGCARAHRPGVYTKVANYMSWISTVLETGGDPDANLDAVAPSCQAGHRRCALGQCMPSTGEQCDKDFCPPPS